MEEEKKRPRIFYGWWIMVGAALCGFVTSGGIQTIAVAAPHLEAEFAWSRTTIVGAVAMGAVVMGLMGLAAGHLVDRIGPRIVAITGAIVGATGLMLASLTTANTPWMWYTCKHATKLVYEAGCPHYFDSSGSVRAGGCDTDPIIQFLDGISWLEDDVYNQWADRHSGRSHRGSAFEKGPRVTWNVSRWG